MPALSDTDKAAIGFMDHAMGESPSSDDLRGMSGAIDDYADRAGVDSDQLRSSLQKMLPTTSQHPDYQVDSASGAVSGASGQKVYGEQRRVMISKKQLQKIIREKSLESKMGITKSQLRRIIREAGGSRSAGEVFRATLDRAVEMAKERRMGAPELNDGGFDALIDQAFKELNPPEFASREDLDAQNAQETASTETQVRGQLENRVTERRIRQIIRRVTRHR
jgi:hypothetical protein